MSSQTVTVSAKEGFDAQVIAAEKTKKPFVIEAELTAWDDQHWTIQMEAPAGQVTAQSLTDLLAYHIPTWTDKPRKVELISATPFTPPGRVCFPDRTYPTLDNDQATETA